ncbi:MAG: DoxX family protein [Roseobacter sp.]
MLSLYNATVHQISRADWVLPTLARFIFAATLALYFWVSGLTKLGDGFLGIFQPSVGAYAQIFPKAMEAVTYDVTQLSMWHYLVVLGGTWAEFILPTLIILGLFTRLSALGMIGFIGVQTLTDLYAHGVLEDPKTLGAWFDRFPDSVIMDQRTFWVFILLVLVIKGAGPIALDRGLSKTVNG